MMHLNTDPAAPEVATKKPCIRDMHELITVHLKPEVVKLVPLDELARRGTELVAEHPRFAEEVPLVLAGEAQRRARHQGLQVAGRRARPLSMLQEYLRA